MQGAGDQGGIEIHHADAVGEVIHDPGHRIAQCAHGDGLQADPRGGGLHQAAVRLHVEDLQHCVRRVDHQQAAGRRRQRDRIDMGGFEIRVARRRSAERGAEQQRNGAVLELKRDAPFVPRCLHSFPGWPVCPRGFPRVTEPRLRFRDGRQEV